MHRVHMVAYLRAQSRGRIRGEGLEEQGKVAGETRLQDAGRPEHLIGKTQETEVTRRRTRSCRACVRNTDFEFIPSDVGAAEQGRGTGRNHNTT